MKPTSRRLRKEKPHPECRHALLLWPETSPAAFTCNKWPQHVVARSARNHGWDSGARRHLSGDHLAPHSSAAQLGSRTQLGFACKLSFGDQLCARGPGCTRVKPLDLGE